MPAENRDVRGNDIKPASILGDGIITEGDGTTRRIWVIANGAADPADATAEDIIFEENA